MENFTCFGPNFLKSQKKIFPRASGPRDFMSLTTVQPDKLWAELIQNPIFLIEWRENFTPPAPYPQNNFGPKNPPPAPYPQNIFDEKKPPCTLPPNRGIDPAPKINDLAHV